MLDLNCMNEVDNFIKILNLISETDDILKKEREKGKGKLKDNIEEIKEREYFFDYPAVYLPVKGEVIFIGDTHGDVEATLSIIKQTRFLERMDRKDNVYLVFLGDYADRGAKQIENLVLVLNLKKKFPNYVVLLRGNHEEIDCGQFYGFLNTCLTKFGHEKGLELFQKFNDFFEKLPGMVVTKNGIFAVHGGIPSVKIHSLRDLNDEEILSEMRWNDPTDETRNFIPNYQRGGYYMFGEKIFNKFMKTVNGFVLIRGHEYNQKGYKLMFSDRLITIFSTGSGSRESGYSDFVLSPKYLEVSLEKKIKKWSEKYLKDIEYKNKDS